MFEGEKEPYWRIIRRVKNHPEGSWENDLFEPSYYTEDETRERLSFLRNYGAGRNDYDYAVREYCTKIFRKDW